MMLRAGATLDEIGTVLRHKSPDTTAHYAKVDIAALQQIAQPWPKESKSC
jgi:site-specific recombinase XerD